MTNVVRMRRARQSEWQTWSDPRQTEKNYDRYRQQRRDYALLRMRAELEKLSVGTAEAPLALLAARAGLSAATIRRYFRRFEMGTRGPAGMTLMLLSLMREDDVGDR